MTTTEQPAPKRAERNPTAKELAEDSLAQVGQLRTELTELRTAMREGGTVTLQAGEPQPDPRVKELDDEFGQFVDAVNKRFAELAAQPAGVAALDTAPFEQKLAEALSDLESKVGASFKAQSEIINAWGKTLTEHDEAVKELREWQAQELEEPPFAQGDINDVHQRINDLREDLGKLRSYLDSPTFGAIERAADVMATARGGLVLGAAPQAGVPAIYGQVHRLMNAVTELGKDKTADKKMGGYQFRSIDAAMDAVGRALREVGVMFQPREIVHRHVERYETVSKDGYRQNWTHVWVTQRYAFVSLIDGSEMDAIEMDGEARDNGDKSTSKADSMRLKYALLQALMIPVNGLPESDGRDGTEGGHVYGRGSAGDAFDNAVPARPAGLTEQHVDSRPSSTPEEAGNHDGTAYGYGHQPADSPGGQAHAQAQQQAEEDTRTPEEKAQAAYNALVALAMLEKPAQRPKLNKILNAMNQQGIADIEVTAIDGSVVVLGRYAAAVNAKVGA